MYVICKLTVRKLPFAGVGRLDDQGVLENSIHGSLVNMLELNYGCQQSHSGKRPSWSQYTVLVFIYLNIFTTFQLPSSELETPP